MYLPLFEFFVVKYPPLVYIFVQVLLTDWLRSQKKLPGDLNVVVDLDAEQGRAPGRVPNTFRLVVRPTKSVNLQVVEEYVKGNTSFSKDALEGLSKYSV